MRASLVFPPFHLESLYSLPPLGLINLATAASLAGHVPAIHDFVLELREGKVPMGPGLYAACAERVLGERPEVVAFSAQCTTYPAMIGLARELKRRDPKLTIVAGGHNASFVDVKTLTGFPEFDAVVRGEGEVTFPALLDAMAAGRPIHDIDGVTARLDGRVVRAPDRYLVKCLDDLPVPDYALGPSLVRYRDAYDLQKAIAILEVGRGCPHACAYCSESVMWRRKIRTFSVARLVDEMRRLSLEQGAESFLLSYDQFTANRDFVREFCAAVLDAGLSGNEWYCISRLDTVDPELFALMRDAGCRSMCYGIDSGSKRTLAFINKRIDEGLLYRRVRETTEHGMVPTLSFIVGFPQEELVDIDATLALALKCGIQGNVSPLMQLPTVLAGTALHAGYADALVRVADTYFALGLEFDQGQRLPGDEACIASDPALFSCFYNLPCPGLAVKDLADIAASFPVMINLFPKTFLLLATAFDASPAKLFLRFLSMVRQKEETAEPLSPASCYRHFPAFAELLLTPAVRQAWPVLPSVARYEALAVAAAGDAGRAACPGPDKPVRRERVLTAAFDIDMEAVVADLKAGIIRRSYPADLCAVVFTHDGNRLTARRVNTFGKDVLELCDGDHTLEDIARVLQPRHGAGLPQTDFAAHCRNAVAAFQSLGLVSATA